MTYPDFSEFFEQVHGFTPYAWQIRAADYAAEQGELPRTLDIPTGLGKTALVDIWLWALGREVVTGNRRLYQRFVHAVERRTIVDGADKHMRQLQAALSAPQTPALGAVAAALEELAGEGNPPLVVTSFHGSRADDRSWIAHPRGAVVLTTTVTQLTLRVLGQAPGVSQRTRIIHAGLLGHDAHWVVDEPHLSSVAVDTLHQCAQMSDVSLTCLGATVPTNLIKLLDPDDNKTIRFAYEDESPECRRRYAAPRPVQVHACAGANGFAKVALSLLRSTWSPERRTVVFANIVGQAVELVEAIEREAAFQGRVRLVTSRVRPADRSGDPSPVAGEIVVATQTLEAGVDFEVDLLITPVAAWPAIVQRIGRLNRYGSAANAQGHIIVQASGTKAKPDPGSAHIYGAERLELLGTALLSQSELDFSLQNQARLGEQLLGDNSPWPEPVRTGCLDAELAALMLLAPAPESLTLWLRGLDQHEETAPVTVLWRDCLDSEILRFAPPQRLEQIDLTPALARGLVAGAWDGFMADVDDADSGYRRGKQDSDDARRRVQMVRVRTGDEWFTPRSLGEIPPGSTLVLHTSIGNYRPDRGVWPSSDPVEDVHSQAGSARVVVLTPEESTMSKRDLGAKFGGHIIARTESHAVVVSRRSLVNDVRSDGLVTLLEHGEQTKRLAAQFVAGSACSGGLTDVVVRAAELHDIGKAHPSVQRYLGARQGDELIAKSSGRDPLPREIARPVDHADHGGEAIRRLWPHEGRLAHLVAAHHGARGTEEYRELSGEHPWRLAWQETIVRLADWEASRRPVAASTSPTWGSTELLEWVSRDLGDRDEGPSVQLPGLRAVRTGAWYATIGVAVAAEEALGRGVQLSWSELDRVPTLHGVAPEELPSVVAWINGPYTEGLACISDALAQHEGDFLRQKSHTIAAPRSEPQVLWRAAREAVIASRVLMRVVDHLVSPNMPILVKDNERRLSASGGWLHSNGIVLNRIMAAPSLTVDTLLREHANWVAPGDFAAPDHALDRVSNAVPGVARLEEYRPISLGIAGSGRPLTQTGVAHARGSIRWMPVPSVPTTLWKLEVQARLRARPALIARQGSVGKMSIVSEPALQL